MSALAGEIALVTGATGGLGRTIALRLAAEGATVAVTGRNTGAGVAVVTAIRDAGGTAEFRAVDLTNEGDVRDLVAWAVEEFGGLTVLVHAADDSERADEGVHDLVTADWEYHLRLRLTSAAWLARDAIGVMLDAGHGSIVHVTSTEARRAGPGHAARVAGMAGLEGLTRSIAVDYGGDGIRANTIEVGPTLDVPRRPPTEAERRAVEAVATGGPVTADDVAAAVVFLAGPASGGLSGATLPFDHPGE